jgi:hypothetical protein
MIYESEYWGPLQKRVTCIYCHDADVNDLLENDLSHDAAYPTSHEFASRNYITAKHMSVPDVFTRVAALRYRIMSTGPFRDRHVRCRIPGRCE